MTISKREFFKHKNHRRVYSVYETAVDRAYELSERYANKLCILRKRKDEYRANLHIWKILSKVENDNASSFESCAFLRCNNLKRTAFIVTPEEYDNVILDTQKLAKALGNNIEGVLDFVDHLEHNNLTVRAK